MKNYITRQGAEKLKAELKKLLYEDRPELVKVVGWAAGNGDRSENGDYIYGKRKLREIDRRIRMITLKLEKSEIVDPSGKDTSRVVFGATVVVLDEQECRKTYRIVGQDETDVGKGWISWDSPVGKALLSCQVGSVAQLRTPKGIIELEVIEIYYEST